MIMTLVTSSQATLQIQKIESQSGFTIIKTSEIELPKDFHIVLHIIDPIEILNVVQKINNTIFTLPKIQQKKFIQDEIETVINKINTIIPHRHKRGIFNGLGTVMNWLYGTMDNNDRQEIEKHLSTIDSNNHEIITNMNQQIKINDNFQKSINRLKISIENDRQEILTKLDFLSDWQYDYYENLIVTENLIKLNIIKSKIEHIQENIASARLNLLNPNILTNDEILTYNINFKKLSHLRLGVAKYNEKKIIFAIKIPTNYVVLNKKLIIPIINSNYKKINDINKYSLEINGTYFEYNPEKSFKELFPLKHCVFSKSCKLINNNDSKVMEIEDNVIILENVRNLEMTSNCDERNFIVSGNYFIDFYNCSIFINKKNYTNYVEKIIEKFVLPESNQTYFNNSLTFDEIVLETQNNLKYINELKYHKIITYSISSFTTILVLVVLFYLLCKQKHKIKIFNKIQENLKSKEGGVTSSYSYDVPIDKNCSPEFIELSKIVNIKK